MERLPGEAPGVATREAAPSVRSALRTGPAEPPPFPLSADRSASLVALGLIAVGAVAVVGLWWQDTIFISGFGD
jgi:hypothetical protein